MGGTLMTIQVPSVLTPVIYTGATESLEEMFVCFKGYFRMIYDLTCSCLNESSYIDMISELRILLFNFGEEMNRIYPNPPNEDGVQMIWLSQYTLTLFQWSLIGPIILFPGKVGLHGSHGREYLEVLNYLIGMIGHFIGLDEKYNLCLETYEETQSLCKIFFRKIIQPILKNSVLHSTPGYKIACYFGRSAQPFFSAHVTGEMILKYWYSVFGLLFAYQPIITSGKDRFVYNFWQSLMASKSRRTRRLLMKLFLAKHKGADKHILEICVKLASSGSNIGMTIDQYACEVFADGIVRMQKETNDTKLTRSRVNTRESSGAISLQSNSSEVIHTQL